MKIKKSKFYLLLPVLAMVALSACNKTEDVFVTQFPHNWINASHSLIAHGGGAFGGFTGLNITEAIEHNYNAGHRVFEIDLNLTTDGRLAAVHDWPSYRGPLSSEEFSKVLIADRYPSAQFDDICRLMAEYPDMYLVTDTKSFEYDDWQIKAQFEEIYKVAKKHGSGILNRIVPQIYNQKMYNLIMDVYPFNSIIYTLYESPDTDDEVIEFVRDKEEIKVITMSPVRLSNGFVRELKKYGKVIYCFTINDLDEMREYILRGATGFYTDFVIPAEHFYENASIR